MATKLTLASVAIRLALLGGALTSGALHSAPGDGVDVEWPHYAADQASSKYLPVDLINPGNVRRLVQKWVWESPDNAIVAQANAGGSS